MSRNGTGFGQSSSAATDEVYIQSRDSRPLDRYFPELHDALLERLPKNCVMDGEIVIATARGLDFDALQLRLHPAASRTRSSRKRHRPRSLRSMRLPSKGARSWQSRKRRAARLSSSCFAR